MSEATLTLRELFEAPQDISARVEPQLDALATVQDARQEIAKASRAIWWGWVRTAVADKSQELLNFNVIDLLAESWKKYLEISQYGDTKKYGRDETILAPLYEHIIKSKHTPYIQILLKEQEVGRVEFNLEFSLTLDAFALKIRNGRIWEIQAGSAKGEGSLTFAGITAWREETKPLRFPGRISLGNGIPLVNRGLSVAG